MSDQATIAKRTIIHRFMKQFPSDAAFVMESFTRKEINEYLSALSADEATEVFSRINPDVAFGVLQEMDDHLFEQIFSRINSQTGARILSRFKGKDLQQKLDLLPESTSREFRGFMVYEPDSAGFLMETMVTSFKGENSADDALQRIRSLGDRRVTSVYLTDDQGVLIGFVPLQLIAIAQPEEKLSSLMKSVPSVNAFAPREEVLQILEQGNLLQVPVTDINQKLLGVIRNDVLIDATKQEVTESLQAMFGAGREERALSKVSFAVRKRLPWLQINLATAFLASFVVGIFEDTIAQITILAVFLPVVAGQSGNTGSQALAVTMRGLALREIGVSQWFQVARKEIMVGFINGVAVALTTGAIVYFWASSFGIALVIAISMILSMVIAGFAGAAIPIILKSLGQDPATSSSIILTTVTDICGFLSFLGLAASLASVLGII